MRNPPRMNAMPTELVNGLYMHYTVYGESGPPVVLIHGLGSCGDDWSPQLNALSPHYRCLAFDLRGHGLTQKPRSGYSMSQFARDTAGLMRQVGFAPAHIVGFSLGGMVALQLALDEPRLVQSLTIVNSGPEHPAMGWRRLAEGLKRLAIIHLLGTRTWARMLAPRALPRPDQEGLRSSFIERMSQTRVWPYSRSLRAIGGWSVMHRLDEIRCPVLVVAAESDYTPTAFKEAYTARMANARLEVVADSRHITPLDQTEVFNRLLMDFLAEVNGADPGL